GPQSCLEFVRGHYLEIVCEIEAGRTVKDSAILLYELDEFHLAEVLGSLEHHVLEEVGEACAVTWLVAEADVVVHSDADRGRGPVLGENDLQAVVELVIGDGDVKSRVFFLPGDEDNGEQGNH